MRSDRLLKLKNKERDVHKFHFNFFIQWERERERLRESQREKPWGRAGLPEGATSNAAPEQRQSDLRSPMTDLPSTICKNFISFFHFSEIKRERKREKKREIPWGRAGGSTEHRIRGRPICDLWSPICDEGRATMTTRSKLQRRSDVTVGYWVWFAGVWFWFWFVYWGFFFFLDKHLCHFVFGLLLSLICFCLFALYRQYWGLISLPPIWFLCSDVMGSIFWFSVLIFFFFFVENPWACRERATSIIYWAHRGLLY